MCCEFLRLKSRTNMMMTFGVAVTSRMQVFHWRFSSRKRMTATFWVRWWFRWLAWPHSAPIACSADLSSRTRNVRRRSANCSSRLGCRLGVWRPVWTSRRWIVGRRWCAMMWTTGQKHIVAVQLSCRADCVNLRTNSPVLSRPCFTGMSDGKDFGNVSGCCAASTEIFRKCFWLFHGIDRKISEVFLHVVRRRQKYFGNVSACSKAASESICRWKWNIAALCLLYFATDVSLG